MVNETISYKSPEKIKSIMHYLNTDRETRISPVGVYSSLGEVDYFAFQRSTKTFKVDFLQQLTKNGKDSVGAKASAERGLFRSFDESGDDKEEFGSGDEDFGNKDSSAEQQDNQAEKMKRSAERKANRKQSFFAFESVNFIDVKEKVSESSLMHKNVIANAHGNSNIKNDTIRSNIDKNHSVINANKKAKTINKNNFINVTNINNNNNNNKLKKSSNKKIDVPNSKKNSVTTGKAGEVATAAAAFVEFNLEYIYDAKHLIHSVSDFRSTPDFNNITYNFDHFIWNLKNENSDKSDETVKIELFFDMEESFYSENIFINLNFTKTIILLNQTEKSAIENSYSKISSNILLEVANYTFSDGAVYLMEKVMHSSPDLDKLNYFIKSEKNKHKNDLIKIMKVEAEKVLGFNESFQLEVKFPLYFENCRNYKTNTMIMITGIVLMVFLGSLLYLVVSLNFSDKD